MLVRLAWRSLWRQRRRTLINISSIGLGMTVALVIISLTEGIYHQIIEDGVRIQAGHLTLEHSAYRQAPSVDLFVCGIQQIQNRLAPLPAVAHLKPLILGQGVAKSGMGTVGAMVMGVEPGVEQRLSPLAGRIVAGTYLSDSDTPQAFLGSGISRTLQVSPGKKVILTTNNAAGELVEELFRVKGVFQTGAEEVDGSLLQIPINQARRLFGLGPDCVTQLGVILTSEEHQAAIRQNLKSLPAMENLAVRSWQEISPDLAAHVRLDRAANCVFQGLLLVIILFTILNTLLMSCLEREKEFAVLLALGTPPLFLKAQLLLETVLLGLLGCGLGALLGGGLAQALSVWGLDLSPFLASRGSYSGLAISTHIHARLTPAMFLGIMALFQGATTLLGFWPWRRVSAIQMVELLR
jgi:ABC-type lipoprotein release transport system permease subunit